MPAWLLPGRLCSGDFWIFFPFFITSFSLTVLLSTTTISHTQTRSPKSFSLNLSWAAQPGYLLSCSVPWKPLNRELEGHGTPSCDGVCPRQALSLLLKALLIDWGPAGGYPEAGSSGDLGEHWGKVSGQHGPRAAPSSSGTILLVNEELRHLLKAGFCPRISSTWKRATSPHHWLLKVSAPALCQSPERELLFVFVLFHSCYLRLAVGLGSKRGWRDPFIKCFLVFAATLALHSWHSNNICSMVFSVSLAETGILLTLQALCFFCFFFKNWLISQGRSCF